MSITLVANGTVAFSNSGGNVTPALPTGWAVGDIFVLVLGTADNVVSTLPAGWTKKIELNGNVVERLTIAWRRAVAGDTDPLVTHAAGGEITARISAFRGCVTTGDPFSASSSLYNSTASTTITATGITPLEANDMVIFIPFSATGATSNPFSAYSGTNPTFAEAWQEFHGPDTLNAEYETIALVYGINTGPTATGNRTATQTQSQANIGALLSLIPVVLKQRSGVIQTRQTWQHSFQAFRQFGFQRAFQRSSVSGGNQLVTPGVVALTTASFAPVIKLSVIPPTIALATSTFAPQVNLAVIVPHPHAASYPTEVLADTPKIYWKLGETAGPTAADASGNGQTGTYAGSSIFGIETPVEGTGVSFPASGDTVARAHEAAQDVGDVFSIEFWLRRLASGLTQSLIDNGAGGYTVFASSSSNKIVLQTGAQSTFNVRTNVAVTNTDWHHYVFTKNGATALCYIDGLDASEVGTNDTAANTTSPFSAGGDGTVQLDDVALYGTALSPARVLAHYLAAVVGLQTASFAPTITVGAGNVTVTPPVDALVTATFAPVIQLGVLPGVVALTTATFAPAIGQGVVPTTVTLVTSTFAPKANLAVIPPTVALTASTFAPVIGLSVVPGAVALTTSTFAPAIGQGVVPTTKALVTSAFAPTISLSNNQLVTPATATLATTTFAPQVNLGVIPPTVALTTATFAPQVNLAVVPGTTALALTTYAPPIGKGLVPATVALTTSTFAPTISLSNNISVTPGAPALATSAFAPVIGLTDIPPQASLTLSTFAPTVSTPQTITPAAASLTTATFAPAVGQGVVPATAALVTTSYAPLLGLTITPAPASLSTSASAPVIGLGDIPAQASLSLATFAPTVTTPQTITPAAAPLTTSLFAPVVALGVVPATASLATSTFVPVVGLGDAPPSASLALTAYAPTIALGVVPATTSLTLTELAPTVSLSNHISVTPDTATLTTTSYAPTLDFGEIIPTPSLALTISAPVVAFGVVPNTASLVTTTFAPDVATPQTVSPATATLTLAGFAPSADISNQNTVVPQTAVLVTSAFAPTISASDHQTVSPATAVLSLNGFAPVMALGVVPGTASLSLSTFAPSLTAAITVGSVGLTLSTFAPTITVAGGSVVVTPSTAVLHLTRFAATVTGTGRRPTAGGATFARPQARPRQRVALEQHARFGFTVSGELAVAPRVLVSGRHVFGWDFNGAVEVEDVVARDNEIARTDEAFFFGLDQ